MKDDFCVSLQKILDNTDYKEDINHFKEDIHNLNNLIEKGICFLSPIKLNENGNNKTNNLKNESEIKEKSNKKKKKYILHSYSIKRKILKESELYTIKELVLKYKIPYSTISRWVVKGIGKKTSIQKINKIIPKKRLKRIKNLSNETIDRALEIYNKYPPGTITRSFFRREVLKIAEEQNFQASYGWLARFEKKNDLKFLMKKNKN